MSMTGSITPPDFLTHSEALARARALVPIIREHVAEAEYLRRQPTATIQAILDTGLARLLVPKRWGGYELPLDTMYDTVFEIAKADASTGWCYSLIVIHQLFLVHFSEKAQHEVWGNGPDVAIANILISNGKVTRVEDGYRLSGNWPWVSGIDHCSWVTLSGLLPSPDGNPPVGLLLLIPRPDFEIQDTWFVSGLRGSGSNNVIVNDVFVPEHRALDMASLMTGNTPASQIDPNPLLTWPFSALFPISLVSPIVGASRGAYELWRNHIKTKSTNITSTRLATFSHQHIRIAEIEAEISTAELLLRRILHVLCNKDENYREQHLRIRRDYAYIATLCIRAVERMFSVAGGSANYDTNALQRFWRDIHAMGAHTALNFDATGEAFGRLEAGLIENTEGNNHNRQ
jgi:3-hydroxy-9,10-secoandrosta-1,3,5(10)-triene-9,17-dione monooxygenase